MFKNFYKKVNSPTIGENSPNLVTLSLKHLSAELLVLGVLMGSVFQEPIQ
jgi:hypothetical protein